MGIQVLGPLTVDGADGLRPRERVVLATLVLRRGAPVAPEVLADACWADDPPATWPKQVQASISRVRRVVVGRSLVTTSAGYVLTLEPDDLDAERFEREIVRARSLDSAGEHERAAAGLSRALRMWAGDPYGDLAGWESALPEITRLEEMRRSATDDLLDARLAAGEHVAVAAEAEAALLAEPLRERRWASLALAQYRSGRQADALATLRRARQVLDSELGIEPSRALAELEVAMLRQEPALAPQPVVGDVSAACPYRGLVPFGQADEHLFFGRDDEIEQCLARAASTSVLVLTGPSGCGKSSLLRAGLLAALGRDGREVVVTVPASDPVGGLDASLAGAGPQAVVAVDQLEELFAGQHAADVQLAFCRRLAAHARTGLVVLAVRADHVGGVSIDPELARLAEQGMCLVPALRGDALRAAIEEPARRAGLVVEHGLTDLLLRDVGDEAGALPMLSHALVETWRRRDGRTLTIEGYELSGGISGAVARSADRLYDGLPPDERAMCRWLLLRLVSPAPDGAPVRRRLPAAGLRDDPTRDRLVASLVASRLLTSDADAVEIAHESLVRAWPRLQSWLDDDAAGVRLLRHLVTAAEGWQTLGRPDGELYTGARLDATLEWVAATSPDLTATEREFLAASQEHHVSELALERRRVQHERTQNRRLRATLGATAVLLAVAMVAGGVALRSDRAARGARDTAQLEALTSTSAALRSTNRALAALLAVEAERRWPGDARTRSALLSTFTGSPGLLGYERVDAEDGLTGAVLPGGTEAVVAIDGIQPALMDLTTGELRHPFPTVVAGGGPGSAVRLSADGRTAVHLALGSAPGCPVRLDPKGVLLAEVRPVRESDRAASLCATVGVYSVPDGAEVMPRTVLSFGYGEVAISPDGTRVAVTRASDVGVVVLDAHTGGVVGTLPPVSATSIEGDWGTGALAFGPDGMLYVGSLGTQVRVVDPRTAALVRTVDVPSQSTNAFIGFADGRLIGVGHQQIAAVDLADGRVLWSAPLSSNRQATCPWVAMSAATERLYCGSFAGIVEERDLATGGRTGRTFDTQGGNTGAMDVVDGGDELVVFTPNAPTVVRWRLDGAGPVARVVAPGRVVSDGYDASGRWAVTAAMPTVTQSDLSDVRAWDVRAGVAAPAAQQDTVEQFWVSGSALGGALAADESLVGIDLGTGAVTSLPNFDFVFPAADGLTVAISDGLARLVRLPSDEPVGPTMTFGATTFDVSASADGDWLVTTADPERSSALDDIVTTVWDTSTGTARPAQGRGWWPVVAGPGDLLVGAHNVRLARLDPDTFEPVAEYAGSGGDIRSLRLSADGSTLVAVSSDQTVSVYDVASGTRLGDPIRADATYRGPAFVSADGHRVLVSTRTGVVEWDLEEGPMAEAACRVAGRDLTRAEWASYLADLGPYRSTCGYGTGPDGAVQR